MHVTVYVDGSYFDTECIPRGGWAYFISDHHHESGRISSVECLSGAPIRQIAYAEWTAACYGIRAAIELGSDVVTIVSDCDSVVFGINGTSTKSAATWKFFQTKWDLCDVEIEARWIKGHSHSSSEHDWCDRESRRAAIADDIVYNKSKKLARARKRFALRAMAQQEAIIERVGYRGLGDYVCHMGLTSAA